MKLAGHRSLVVLPIILFCVVVSFATVEIEEGDTIITSFNREDTILSAYSLRKYDTGVWGSLRLASFTPAKTPVHPIVF